VWEEEMERLKFVLTGIAVLIFIAGFFSHGWAQTIQIYNNEQQPCTTVLMHGYFNVHFISPGYAGDTVRVRIESDIDSGCEIFLKPVLPQGPVEWHYHTVDSPIRVWDAAVPFPPSFFCRNFLRATPSTGLVRVTAVDFPGTFQQAMVVENLNPKPYFNVLSLFNGNVNTNVLPVSPDNDGDTDFLNVNYNSSDTGPSWVVIDTNRNGIFEVAEDWVMPGDWTQPIWAKGNRGMVSFWDGRDQRTGQVLPNGIYDIMVYTESWNTGQWTIDSQTLKVELLTAGCSGTVMSGGNPVPDAKVTMGNPSSFGWAKTDTAGNYVIYGLKPGLYHGHVEKEGYTFADSDGISVLPGTITGNVNFILGGPGDINVNILLSEPNNTDDTLYGKVDVWSTEKPQGTGIGISFAPGEGSKIYGISLAPGNYMLRATLPRYAPKILGPIRVETSASTDCLFTLDKALSISGTVILPEPNLSPDPIFIGVNAKGSWPDNRGFGGAQIAPGQNTGPFVIYDLLPDTYTLQAHCDKYPDFFLSNLRVDTDVIGVLVNFNTGSRITGNISLKKRGMPVSNPQMVIEAHSPSINRGVMVELFCDTGPFDETLAYEIRGLEPSRYFVRYNLEGFEREPIICDLGVNETKSLDVILERAKGAIAGKVCGLKSSMDYAAVQILFSRPGESTFKAVSVDTGAYGNTGAYRIMNLSTGQYVLTANKWVVPGYPTGEYPNLSKQVFVASGDTVINVDFNFSIDTPGAIMGTVNYTGEKGYNLTGKMVYAIPAAAAVYGAQAGWQCPIQFSNFYLIPGLMPGAYKVMVETNIDTSNDKYGVAVPDVVCVPKIVNVMGGNTVVANFTLTDGYKIKGNVILPDTLPYEFHCGVDCHIKGPYPEENHIDVVIPSGERSATYELSALMPGDYVVAVHSPDFIHSVREVKIINQDLNNINFYLTKGASIKGKIIDADNGAVLPLVGGENKNLGIYVHAEARPWIEGGYKEADMEWREGISRVKLDPEGKFTISNLPAGTYEVIVSCPSVEMGKSYVNVNIGGIVIPSNPSYVADIGVIALKPGMSISGKVWEIINPATGETRPLANIPVKAKITGIAPHYWEMLRTVTRLDGSYTLNGVSPEKYYDIMAGTEMGEFDFAGDNFGIFGPRFGLEIRRQVPPGATNVDFVLQRADCVVQGTISKQDSQPLGFSMEDMDKVPGALVVLKRMGSAPINDNPILDGLLTISMPMDNTGRDYKFERAGLVRGKYIAKVLADGYCMASKSNIDISPGMNNLGNFALFKGGSATGTIKKEDGTAVTEEMAQRIAAVTPGFTKFATGIVNIDPSSGEVINYLIEGLEPGNTYSIGIAPKTGRDIYVVPDCLPVQDTGTITYNITMKELPPKFHLFTRKIDNRFKLEILSTRTLSEPKAEDVITLLTGGDTAHMLFNYRMDPDKMRMSVEYIPPLTEDSFTIQVKGHTESGKEGIAVFRIYTGADAQVRQRINIFTGGSVNVGEGDATRIDFTEEAITMSEGNETGTAEVSIDKLQSMLFRSGALKLSASAYPFLPASADISPGIRVSAIYNIILNLFGNLFSGKGITVTLEYDSSTADVENMHVFYYNESTGKWEIETLNRSVDRNNSTISVEVNHLSQFAVFNTTFAAGIDKLTTYNYPNPFKPGTQASTTIKFGFPGTASSPVSVKIYNISGELVRTLVENVDYPGNTWNTIPWDGKNDAGEKVASGVYIYIVKTATETAFNKIMLIR